MTSGEQRHVQKQGAEGHCRPEVMGGGEGKRQVRSTISGELVQLAVILDTGARKQKRGHQPHGFVAYAPGDTTFPEIGRKADGRVARGGSGIYPSNWHAVFPVTQHFSSRKGAGWAGRAGGRGGGASSKISPRYFVK